MFSDGSMLSDGWFIDEMRVYVQIGDSVSLTVVVSSSPSSSLPSSFKRPHLVGQWDSGGGSGGVGLVPAQMVLLCASSSPCNPCYLFPEWGRTQLVPCRLKRGKTHNFDLRYERTCFPSYRWVILKVKMKAGKWKCFHIFWYFYVQPARPWKVKHLAT